MVPNSNYSVKTNGLNKRGIRIPGSYDWRPDLESKKPMFILITVNSTDPAWINSIRFTNTTAVDSVTIRLLNKGSGKKRVTVVSCDPFFYKSAWCSLAKIRFNHSSF